MNRLYSVPAVLACLAATAAGAQAPEEQEQAEPAPAPEDDRHIHLDGGETQTMLELEPGSHTVQAILADHRHVPHDPPLMSEKVTFEVLQVQ